MPAIAPEQWEHTVVPAQLESGFSADSFKLCSFSNLVGLFALGRDRKHFWGFILHCAKLQWRSVQNCTVSRIFAGLFALERNRKLFRLCLHFESIQIVRVCLYFRGRTWFADDPGGRLVVERVADSQVSHSLLKDLGNVTNGTVPCAPERKALRQLFSGLEFRLLDCRPEVVAPVCSNT